MKELSIEEKERRYDEAIKIAEALYKKAEPMSGCNVILEKLFPELGESEDERIRKELIEFVKSRLAGFLQCEKYIAWLENQGDKKDIHLVELKAKAYDDAKERMSYAYNKNRVSIEFVNDIFPDIKLYELYANQGEQKPADTVEPKFKKGVWCIDNEDGTIFQIMKVLDNTYTYKTIEGKEYSCTHYSLENDAKLWTIQDAKDGDVLYYRGEISLYKHDIKNCTKQETTFGGFVYHCCYDGKRFIINSLYSLTEQDKMDIHPAAKEQRDQLEKAMADAGYTFDFEKKELKKIEQKSWSEEDEYQINTIHNMIGSNPSNKE